MNDNNETKIKEGESMCMVPQSLMEAMLDSQQRILALLTKVERKEQKEIKMLPQANTPVIEGEYLTQREAMNIVNRRPTWLWNLRNRGLLSFAMHRGKIYYRKEDIVQLHERVRQNKMIDGTKLKFITKKAA